MITVGDIRYIEPFRGCRLFCALFFIITFQIAIPNKSHMGTSFDGCELFMHSINDEAEETVSSPEVICCCFICVGYQIR